MKLMVLGGIEQRAEEFVKQCTGTGRNAVDVYVGTVSGYDRSSTR